VAALDACTTWFAHDVERRRARQAVQKALRDRMHESVDQERRSSFAKVRRRIVEKGNVSETIGDTEIDPLIVAFNEALARSEAAAEVARRAFASASQRALDEMRVLTAEPRFREALTWQNRRAESRIRAAMWSEAASGRDRRDELAIALYAQRYATKNDTIGFYGPVGAATLDMATNDFVFRAGEQLVSKREVHFEAWGVDAIAKIVEPALEDHLRPRRLPFVRVEATEVISQLSGRRAITKAERAILLACDGAREARVIAASLAAEHRELFADAREVLATMADLREQKLLAWGLEVPLSYTPERNLRRALERIEDPARASLALDLLDELDALRARIARSAGDPDALSLAMAALDAAFQSATNVPAERNSGKMYAARALVFEDALRDAELTVGRRVLEALDPALDLLLRSLRWLTHSIAVAFRRELLAIYRKQAARVGTDEVPFSDIWFRSRQLMHGTRTRLLTSVFDELTSRWETLLLEGYDGGPRVTLRSRDLSERVRELFFAPSAGWTEARYHAPDVMLAAADAAAINRGEMTVVLGELHVATNTIDCMVYGAQLPEAGRFPHFRADDLPGPRFIFVPSKEWPRVTARTVRATIGPDDLFVETGFDIADASRDRVLAAADLTVRAHGEVLYVRLPDGRDVELLHVLGDPLSFAVAMEPLRLLRLRPHSPRITIDDVVVSRERWVVDPSTIETGRPTDDFDTYAALQRWSRSLDLPQFVYVKSPIETKPVFVDFSGPPYVAILAKLVRALREANAKGAAHALIITEMFPSFDQLWLRDRAGGRYTSELRLVVVDPIPVDDPPILRDATT